MGTAGGFTPDVRFIGQTTLTEALETIQSLPRIEWVVAALVLVIGYYVSGLIVRLLGRSIARRFRRPSITRTVMRSVRSLVLFITGLIVLQILDVKIGNILISVGIFSAVVGITLAPIIGSVINGLFVLADQPYEIGDLIELTDVGRRGYVEDITLRYTKVFTLDNTFLVIPNSAMRDRDVINYSAEDERTRLSLALLVTYEGNLPEARSIMEQAAKDTPEVIEGGPDIRIGSARYPAAPSCYIDEYADHGVLLKLRYWVKTPYYLGRVRSKVQERVWDALEDADVEIAYPHTHHIFDETSGRAQVEVAGGDGHHRESPTGRNTQTGPEPSGET